MIDYAHSPESLEKYLEIVRDEEMEDLQDMV